MSSGWESKLKEARALTDARKLPDAEARLRAALADAEELGDESAEAATCLKELGWNLNLQGRYADAETALVKSQAIREKLQGTDNPETAQTWNALALVYFREQRYGAAQQLLEKAALVLEKNLGPDDEWTGTALNNLACAHNYQSKYAEAEPIYRRALAIRRKALGDDSAEVAETLDNLGNVLYFLGKLDESEQARRQAVATYRAAMGTSDAEYAKAVSGLATTCRAVHKLDEAGRLFREALDINKKLFGEAHPAATRELNNLGVVLYDQGRIEESKKVAEEVLAIRQRSLRPGDPDLVTAEQELAKVNAAMNQTGWDEERHVWHCHGHLLPAPVALVTFDHEKREINSSIVVVGSGADKFLRHAFDKTSTKGEFVDAFQPGVAAFTYLPLRLGDIRGFKTMFHLYGFRADDRLLPLLLEDFIPHANAIIVAETLEKGGAETSDNVALESARALAAAKRTIPVAILAAEGFGGEWSRIAGLKPVLTEPMSEDAVFPSVKAVAKAILTNLRDDGGQDTPTPSNAKPRPWWKFW